MTSQYVYYEDSYPAYLTNRSRYTDLELSALTEEMNAQGVCFLDMGPVFGEGEREAIVAV